MKRKQDWKPKVPFGNRHVRTVREDGTVVDVWEAECLDCGFVSGMATVRFPGGSGESKLGAGCETRRDRAAVERWVEMVILQTLAGVR